MPHYSVTDAGGKRSAGPHLGSSHGVIVSSTASPPSSRGGLQRQQSSFLLVCLCRAKMGFWEADAIVPILQMRKWSLRVLPRPRFIQGLKPQLVFSRHHSALPFLSLSPEEAEPSSALQWLFPLQTVWASLNNFGDCFPELCVWLYGMLLMMDTL